MFNRLELSINVKQCWVAGIWTFLEGDGAGKHIKWERAAKNALKRLPGCQSCSQKKI